MADALTDDIPTAGSPEAVAKGCICAVRDNAHGLGYMGGVKDRNGETLFVFNCSCPLHGLGRIEGIKSDG